MNQQTIPSLHRRTQDRKVHDLRGAFSNSPDILMVITLLVLLFGCAPIVPTVKEQAAINAEDKALVLVRVQCTVDGQPFESCIFRRKNSIFSDNIFVGFAMGSFDTFGEPGSVQIRALSDESLDAGWIVFMLSPGIYYLAIQGPDSSQISKMSAANYYRKYFQDASRWRIDVPERTKLIYAGTLHLAGKIDGTLLFGDRIIVPSGQEVALSNDQELAGRLLIKHFPDAGEIKTILMQRWHPGDPLIIRSPSPGSKK